MYMRVNVFTSIAKGYYSDVNLIAEITRLMTLRAIDTHEKKTKKKLLLILKYY